VQRSTVMHGRHINDRQWLEVRYGRDGVGLEDAPGLVAADRVREEFAAHHSMLHDGRWRTEAWLGHSGAGAFGGARVNYTVARLRELALEATANTRATDSLTLEALDGRQHQLAAVLSWLIEADLTLIVRLQRRELRVGGEPLGNTGGAELNLDLTLRRHDPRIVVGYRGSVSRFSTDPAFPSVVTLPIADPQGGIAAQQAIAANLVSRRINRHGTGLLITDNLARAWVYRLTAGVDYDFELSTPAWNAALGLGFFPRKSLELNLEGGYTSSASASNAGSFDPIPLLASSFPHAPPPRLLLRPAVQRLRHRGPSRRSARRRDPGRPRPAAAFRQRHRRRARLPRSHRDDRQRAGRGGHPALSDRGNAPQVRR
jgi:hypothetical protein